MHTNGTDARTVRGKRKFIMGNGPIGPESIGKIQ